MTAAPPDVAPHRTIDQVLADARARLDRVTPARACEEAAAGALLVDIRPQAQRAAEGEVPGALVVERNVLEWRFDPASSACLPQASYDLRIIVLCSEGYTSSLAAAALQDLGLRQATDVDGGFRAWQGAGLPTAAGRRPVTAGRPAAPARAPAGAAAAGAGRSASRRAARGERAPTRCRRARSRTCSAIRSW